MVAEHKKMKLFLTKNTVVELYGLPEFAGGGGKKAVPKYKCKLYIKICSTLSVLMLRLSVNVTLLGNSSVLTLD